MITIHGLDIKQPQQIQVSHVPITKVNGEKKFSTYDTKTLEMILINYCVANYGTDT